MHRDPRAAADRRRLSLALGLALWTGCGAGAASTGSGLSVRFEEATILDAASSVALYFYADDGTAGQCNAVRAVVPRGRSLLGPYRADLNDNTKKNGLSFALDDIPVGRYVALADALDAAGTILGTGCAEGQQVFNRQRSAINIVISKNP
ncbi:MAG: hypothetical protein U1E65_32690 [Myxococcota bacterium]